MKILIMDVYHDKFSEHGRGITQFHMDIAASVQSVRNNFTLYGKQIYQIYV